MRLKCLNKRLNEIKYNFIIKFEFIVLKCILILFNQNKPIYGKNYYYEYIINR